jgi:putative sterol carrier protein
VADVQEFFDGLEQRFDPARAEGLRAVVQFSVTGDDGGDWYAEVADGRCNVSEGVAAAPDTTITVRDDHWLAMLDGRLDPQFAFMTGKLKVRGDMGLALRLRSLFF